MMDPFNIASARVHEFERDFESKLQKLPILEQDISNVCAARFRWLKSVSVVDTIETDVFKKKLEVLKVKSDLGYLRVQVDNARLQSFNEIHTLKYLIAATKPYDGESLETRDAALTKISGENLDELRLLLQKSVSLRSSIASSLYGIIAECDKLKMEYQSHRSVLVSHLSDRIQQYVVRLEESVEDSKKNHQTIMGDYLVLRHNAKVARDVLLKGQKEANLTRLNLKQRLDKLVEEAAMQRERMEKAAASELKVLTNDIRDEVISKERELEEIINSKEEYKNCRKYTSIDIKKDIKKYTHKYNLLQDKRRSDISSVGKELNKLREFVLSIEMQFASDNGNNRVNVNRHKSADLINIFSSFGHKLSM